MGKKPLTLAEKRKLFGKVDAEINKKFKEVGVEDVSIVKAKDMDDQDFYPTGIATIDNALGGGIGMGKQFEIYGEFSSGKSTLVLQVIANLLRTNPDATCLYYDQEGAAATKKRMISLGIDMDRLDYMEPSNNVEANLTKIKEYAKQGLYNLYVIDSTNTLVPEDEDTTKKGVNAGGATMAEVARLLSKFTRQMNGPLFQSKASLIYISQTREKPGAMVRPGMPAPVAIGCGKAVGFAISQRLELKKGEEITEGTGDSKVSLGRKVKFKVVKNKLDIPNIKGETVFTYAKGFDPEADAEYFLQDAFEHKISPAFDNPKGITWTFINPSTGTTTTIKGKKNIIAELKEAGEYEAALNVAKLTARAKAKTNGDGSDSYNVSLQDVLGEQLEIGEQSDVEDDE